MTLIWALTGGGYFWPEWVILPLALVVAIHGWVELVEERPRLRRGTILTRGLAIHAGCWAAFVVFVTFVWALTGARLLLAGVGGRSRPRACSASTRR